MAGPPSRETRAPRPRAGGATRAATIVDVAARAGVGTATVSRVLNDGHVSASARDKVLTAIGELDYGPSASARALVSGTTGSLGMVIPFFTCPSGGRADAGRARRGERDGVRARPVQRR